jgi:hypothetical protein
MLRLFQREVRERYAEDPDLLFHCAARVHLNQKRMKRSVRIKMEEKNIVKN